MPGLTQNTLAIIFSIGCRKYKYKDWKNMVHLKLPYVMLLVELLFWSYNYTMSIRRIWTSLAKINFKKYYSLQKWSKGSDLNPETLYGAMVELHCLSLWKRKTVVAKMLIALPWGCNLQLTVFICEDFVFVCALLCNCYLLFRRKFMSHKQFLIK